MKRAFDENTRIHLGRESGGPPGYDSGESLHHWAIQDKAYTPYKILRDSKLIGVVIVWINEQTKEN